MGKRNFRLKKYCLTLCILIIGLSFTGCSSVQLPYKPIIEKGVLDLSQWRYNQDQNIRLDGEWEFYWNRLLSIHDLNDKKPDIYAKVPNTWDTYAINGENLSGQGYATYRLHVKTVLPEGTKLGFRINTFSSAYRLYINDLLVTSNGQVGTELIKETGQYKPHAVDYQIPSSEFDILIHVSNFHYARGGFWHSLSLGSPENIQELQDGLIGKESFILGVLVIIALFYFVTYILSKELKYTLYFALLCIFIALNVDMVGEFILLRRLPVLNFSTTIFIWYSTTALVCFFLMLYVHELYSSVFSKVILRISSVLILISEPLYMVFPPSVYTRFAKISNFTEIFWILCIIIIVVLGIKKGEKDGWLNVISVGIVLLFYTHDVLYATNAINSPFGEIIHFGIFLFIFMQTVIQAQRIRMFHESKNAAELAFLQAQIKPHFLYNALNTVISISRYDVEKSRTLLTDFSQYLRRSFEFKNSSYLTPLKKEIELVKAYVEIEKARFEERLVVTFEVPDGLEVKIPILMLQPLIENAILHGILAKPEGGKVEISIKEEPKNLIFRIKDDGIGMDANMLRQVMKSDKEKGVGLANIDARLRRFYGRGLEIKSSLGNGTEIFLSIPLNNRGIFFYDKSTSN